MVVGEAKKASASLLTSTTQSSNGKQDQAGKFDIVESTQSTGLALSSPLPTSSPSLSTSSPDLLGGMLKISSENSLLHNKLAESLQVNAQLSLEIARLHEQLANISDPVLPAQDPEIIVQNSSVAVDDFAAFTCFDRLPIELRLKIWKLVAHQPRIVEVREDDWDENDRPSWGFKFMNHTPPAVLYVDQESRKEGLRHYKLKKFNNWQHKAYFNKKSDVLYLGFNPSSEDEWEGRFTKFLGKSVSRVAIASDTFHKLLDSEKRYISTWKFNSVIKKFARHGIKEILLVDESFTKNPAEKTDHLSPSNLNRNLHLKTVSLWDELKDKVTGRPWDYFEPLQSVGEFLEDMQKHIQETVKHKTRDVNDDEESDDEESDNEESDNEESDDEENDDKDHDSTINKYKPTLTMTRLKFAQPRDKEAKEEEVEDELGFVYEGGKRQINWL